MDPVDPRRDPARNLLFGLLAFQLNFIDCRSLLAAFDAWTADKSRPLGRVLAEHGAISDDLLNLINGLVAAHLAKHDNEPEKSLAALTPLESAVEDLMALADPDIQATLTRVSADREKDGSDSTIGYAGSAGTPTSAGLRFRILRPLSQGGMGVVSVALDTELDRPIALKEIRDAAAHDSAYRARFLAEAEITGKLEHPGIIPIYGLGNYADGRPFYAMRLIRGDKTGSLMDAIERFHKERDPAGRVVKFRGLLGRFLDVCNALSYAHSKGVLHRDLKPDNILLGPYGETLLVDWGLAKAAGMDEPMPTTDDDRVRLNLSGSELSPTVAGSAFGTPGYAPPEQMTGDLANVGPRSDVYGLGAVLYCLMTGRAPFSRKGIDLGGLIKKIEAGDFPPPRQVRAEIDRPLEAICLKAMARKPSERYESARALAADIESYLADESVSAYIEPWSVRARRWAKRHRTLVTSAAASMLVAAAGLVAIAAVQTRARNVLAARNLALDEANGELKRANIAIDAERTRAEDRESQAIAAVRRFGEVIGKEPELKDNPALAPLRARLLREPLSFFRDLRERLQASQDTRPESLYRLASAAFELGALSVEIGNQRDARAAYEQARDMSERLARDRPDVPAYAETLANVENNLAQIYGKTGETGKSLVAIEHAIAILERLLRDDPRSVNYTVRVASQYVNLGKLKDDAGDPAGARKAYEQGLSIYGWITRDNANRVEHIPGMARAHSNLAQLLEGIGEQVGAREQFERAMELREQLVAAHPEDENLADLALTCDSLGRLQTSLGNPEGARKAQDRAVEILERLLRNHPSVTNHAARLAGTLNNRGVTLYRAGDRDGARVAYERALALHERLSRGHPEVPDLASQVGADLSNIVYLDFDAKRYDVCRAEILQAVRWQRRALAANPRNPSYRRFMKNHHDIMAILADVTGDPVLADVARRGLAELALTDDRRRALDVRLDAIAAGGSAKDNAERLDLAEHARATRRYALAARLFADAFEAEPKLARDPENGLTDAASVALLAGRGLGDDRPKPDEAARADLRARGLGWLQAGLSAWKRVAMTAGPGNKELVARALKHWKEDADLAGVRDEVELRKLAEAEREAWKRFWADVDSLLNRVEAR